MGISFGQISSGSGALRGLIEARATGSAGRQVESGVASADGQSGSSSANPFRVTESPVVRVGIRGGTIGATPAAALIALGRTVENVRENTPTIEQIQASFRQRAEEARARVRTELRGQASGVVSDNNSAQGNRPDPPVRSDVQAFFASVNDADRVLREQRVGAVDTSRTGGAAPVSQDGGAESVTPRSESAAGAAVPEPTSTRIDVSV